MNTDKLILKKLKEGLSQSQIAKDVGVPRSVVQRVSDKELGVDPASLKSLTTEQIIQIQKDSSEGGNNTFLAKVHGVSAKVIARALLVKISNHKNNVTVIAPVEGLGENGEFDDTTDIHPGGVAVLLKTMKSLNEGDVVYVGPFMEDRKMYLVGALAEGDIVEIFTARREELGELDRGLTPEKIATISEVMDRLLESGVSRHNGLEVLVNVPGERPFPLKGKFNSKGQVGYYDPITNLTVRVALNRVNFTARTYEVPSEEIEEGASTAKELKGTDLDAFLGKHQIIILDSQVTISKAGKPLTISSEHKAYPAIVQAIKMGDIDRAYELMEPRKAVEKFSQGRLLLTGRKVTWDGYDITGMSMAKRFIEVAAKGETELFERFGKFLDKVFQNPSSKLVQSNRIFEFMQYADIEVDEDGDIIVYKVVRSNYLDKHSGTISNKPGTLVRMARSFVNDDMADLCSYGLHVCALVYIRQLFGSSGDRVVRCKLNPKDIVSITNDYNSSKIRCCEYLVLDDYTEKYNRNYKSIDMNGFYK